MEALEKTIRSSFEGARRAIGEAILATSYHVISPVHRAPWNRDGFYTALEYEDLARHGVDLNPLDLEFPVPADCPYWGMAFEVDGLVWRPLLRCAWLSIERPQGASRLSFLVDRVPKHLASLQVTYAGRPVELVGHRTAGQGLLEVEFDVPFVADDDTVVIHDTGPVRMCSRHGRHTLLMTRPAWSLA